MDCSQELSRAVYKHENTNKTQGSRQDYQQKAKKDSSSFLKPAIHDSRQFEAEILTLKHSVNLSKEENARLKSLLHKAQKEMETKDLYIKELMTRNSPNPKAQALSSSNSSHLISSLRQQIRDLTAELKKTKKENEDVVKSVKMTKPQETQAELKASMEECKRLRNMLDTVLRGEAGTSENPRESDQRVLVKKLTLENQELAKTVKRQEQELLRSREQSKRIQPKKPAKSKSREQKPAIQVQTQQKKVQKKPPSPLPVNEEVERPSHIEKELKQLKEHMNRCT